MGFYSKFVFPRVYDCVMDRPHWAKYRQAQLAPAAGEILEIGVGTGLNLPHYPEHVRRIVTVDPNPGMNRKLQRRIDQCGITVDQRVLSSEQLPFPADSFDCVVSTMTLCSIPDVRRALSELYRVLKPNGNMLFLEHGICPDEKIAKRQRRWDWLQRIFADGCTLTLDVADVLASQPFASVELESFAMEKTPPTLGWMYTGVATK